MKKKTQEKTRNLDHSPMNTLPVESFQVSLRIAKWENIGALARADGHYGDPEIAEHHPHGSANNAITRQSDGYRP